MALENFSNLSLWRETAKELGYRLQTDPLDNRGQTYATYVAQRVLVAPDPHNNEPGKFDIAGVWNLQACAGYLEVPEVKLKKPEDFKKKHNHANK